VILTATGLLRAAQVTLSPIQDTFVREAEPTRNFGATGALAVAGPEAVNGLGQQQGQFDSLIQFDAGQAVSAFNSQFGAGAWHFTGATLVMQEDGAPANTLYNRGPGQFTVSWVSNDNWLEGSGTPQFVTEGVGNEMTWDFMLSLIGSATVSTLGVGTGAGVSGPVATNLNLAPSLLADLNNGAAVTLHLSPITTTLGYTFFSRDYAGNPAFRVTLQLTAAVATGGAGDLNCDGTVSPEDIAPFVLALTDPDAYASAFPACSASRADLNADARTDGLDVQAFVNVLTGP